MSENFMHEPMNDAEILEQEWQPTGPQRDRIWVRDGLGKLVELEVPDDAWDD